MTEFSIPTDKVNIKGSDGEVLINAPLLEIYYILAYGVGTREGLTPRQQMEVNAYSLNSEYGTELKWYEVAQIVDQITDAMEDAKKNTTSTLELLPGIK